MKKSKITEIIDSKEKPIVISFQNGTPRPESSDTFKCDVFKDKNDNLIAAVNAGTLLYTGNVTRNELYDSYIYIRNRRTNEVRLVAVDNFMLKPVINRKRKHMDESLLNKTTHKDLSKQFGSKKSRRATEQVERLKLDVENIKEQLEETVANVEVRETDMMAPVLSENTAYRPHINRKADTIQEVYDLEGIVPAEVLDSLEEEATKMLGEHVIENVTPFIKLEILKVKDSSLQDKVKKVELLLYINYLIKILVDNAKDIGRQKYQVCTVSSQVNSHILNSFTQLTQHGRMRPLSLKDKTLCYILVLTMIASSYTLNLEALAKDVKVGVKRLIELSRILAFTPSANKSVFIIKIPLPAPILGKSSPKKKGRK